MNEVERIGKEIDRAYRDGFWGGGSVRDLFHSLNASEAAAHPISRSHSAWEIALHLAVWHDIFRSRIEVGDSSESRYATDWPEPEVGKNSNWADALSRLNRTHEALVETVKSVKLENLYALVSGKPFTVYEMLHGVAQHDLYHAGQVMMLKKTIRGASAKGAV